MTLGSSQHANSLSHTYMLFYSWMTITLPDFNIRLSYPQLSRIQMKCIVVGF